MTSLTLQIDVSKSINYSRFASIPLVAINVPITIATEAIEALDLALLGAATGASVAAPGVGAGALGLGAATGAGEIVGVAGPAATQGSCVT